jgi:spore germination protein KC
MIRKASRWVVLMACMLGLSGCWDMVEINQLAIGNLAGGDIDPETGNQIVYYHVVNPSALVSQRGNGVTSPVYAYRVEAPTLAELALGATDLLPRDLFPDQFQAYIVTERMARKGLHHYLNFLERQSNRRTDLDLIVTDSPLSEIMNTYTLFERMPGRSLRSLLELQYRSTGRVSPKSRIKDVVEHIDSNVLTVLPMITLVDSKKASTFGRYEHINANKGSLMLSGGAIIKKDKMIGKLSMKQIPLYNLMKGHAKMYYDRVIVNDEKVDVASSKIKVSKKLLLEQGVPVLKVSLHCNLKLLNTEQHEKLSLDVLNQIKETFNNQLIETETAFFELTKSKDWDLFGIEELIGYKRGKAWAELKSNDESWKLARLDIQVRSKLTDVGAIIDPYKGTK